MTEAQEQLIQPALLNNVSSALKRSQNLKLPTH